MNKYTKRGQKEYHKAMKIIDILVDRHNCVCSTKYPLPLTIGNLFNRRWACFCKQEYRSRLNKLSYVQLMAEVLGKKDEDDNEQTN